MCILARKIIGRQLFCKRGALLHIVKAIAVASLTQAHENKFNLCTKNSSFKFLFVRPSYNFQILI
jgi:hypothetical protein